MKFGRESNFTLSSSEEDPSRDLLFFLVNEFIMIKILALILVIIGIAGLVLGVLGIFGRDLVMLNSWALSILGLVFFASGISLLKRRKDTDEV